MEFFDSHAHYNDEKFDQDKDELLNRIYEEKITRIVCAGYNLDSSKQAVKLAEEYDYIYATCGISPNDINEKSYNDLSKIEELAKLEKVVAIGEIGLDYYWNKNNIKIQKDIFIKQIQIANKVKKPIVIHTRDAVMDTINVLKNEIKVVEKGVFHCCPLNIELVKEAVKLGFYISFSGNITFKNAKPDIVVNEVPIDKILIETDCPYMSPEPFRGKRNDSRKVKLVAEKISEIKQIKIEEVARKTYENANKLFKI